VVVKEWLPLSGGRLGSQGVEQFGRSEPLVPGLEYHLFFPDHVHEFDSNQGVLSCIKRFEPQHGPCHPLYTSMILLHDVVEVFHLPDDDVGAVCLVVALDGGFIGVTAVDGDRLGETVAADGFFQKPQGGLCIAVLREQKVNRLAVLIDRAIEIPPLPP